MRAAGVNFVDGLICQGRYQIKPPTPFVPGSEIAGEVVRRRTGVTGVGVGDRVIAFTGFGGFAEQVVVPALSLVPDAGRDRLRPGGHAHPELLHGAVHPDPADHPGAGEWVLVLGAGGGVGLAATDVATALGGRVIAAASTPDKLEAALAIGAEATIAYEEEDLKVRAREISGGGVDVVVDPVGGRHSETCPAGHPASRSVLRHRLRLRADRRRSRSTRSCSTTGPWSGVDWGGWTFKDPLGNRELIGELMDLVGRRSPPSDPTGHLSPRRGGPGDGRAHRPLHRRQGGDRSLIGPPGR